MWSLISYNICR